MENGISYPCWLKNLLILTVFLSASQSKILGVGRRRLGLGCLDYTDMFVGLR